MNPITTHPHHKRLRRSLASWSRWLHIYLSMFGLVTILFFSITGLTLNHPDWFFAEQTTRVTGQLETGLLHQVNPPPENWDESDYRHQVDTLEVAERLRAEHRLAGRVSDFLVFEDECEVTFERPGYAATARIDRASGEYSLDVTANDLATVMNDLHKGRHTGYWWSWVIDVSAVIGTLTGVTGFILIFFLRLRRIQGTATAIVGGIVLWIFYRIAIG
ncbi:PepSY-associated TM helix domain-containing protein [Novipirellula artificiosorum]|uniref:PepSY-associated TM helix n=1 Tax=Novipirellula artificiosorum TaxID=2528016 RepID=A0A5C6D1Z4_9BACT|nr:PepSY-associated TM helix domain-containing protein [Novipirellula artificiosorum]TWU30850.1 hypothetical protein Poly41_65440 [Novipirellula artificiosorum]